MLEETWAEGTTLNEDLYKSAQQRFTPTSWSFEYANKDEGVNLPVSQDTAPTWDTKCFHHSFLSTLSHHHRPSALKVRSLRTW